MATSAAPGVAEKSEAHLLWLFHTALHAALDARDRPCPEYTLDVLTEHYEPARLDFVRFMTGWGFRGNCTWAEDKARAYLARAFP